MYARAYHIVLLHDVGHSEFGRDDRNLVRIWKQVYHARAGGRIDLFVPPLFDIIAATCFGWTSKTSSSRVTTTCKS
jgi:hypothetical protein